MPENPIQWVLAQGSMTRRERMPTSFEDLRFAYLWSSERMRTTVPAASLRRREGREPLDFGLG